MEEFSNKQKVWLTANSLLWSLAATTTNHFFMECHDGRCYGGIVNLWPFEGFDEFQNHFSIEEWVLFAAGPWILVYFLNKGKES